MILCILLCTLPLVLPYVAHVAACLAGAVLALTAKPAYLDIPPDPYALVTHRATIGTLPPAPQPVASYPCRVATVEPRAYPMPILRAPRGPSGRMERPVDTYECAALAAPYLTVPSVL